MTSARNLRVLRIVPLLIAICLCSLPTYAKYSGGTGEPNDPYQIATAEDLMALGETPEDYDKHFILTADIDLSAFDGKEGRPAFTIIGDSEEHFFHVDVGQVYLAGTPFTGVFDGNMHIISNLTAINANNAGRGLFGGLACMGQILNLGVVDVNVTSSDGPVGGLVAYNHGTITHCYSTGIVTGQGDVGGLVGSNLGSIIASYSTATVSGTGENVGGLVGYNREDNVEFYVGRGSILSYNGKGRVAQCYSTGSVSGKWVVGGLVGDSSTGSITTSYSTATVSGTGENVGGLVGSANPLEVTHSVWDVETSGLSGSAGGVGLTTAEMMDPHMLGLNGFANDPNWLLDPGRDYPRLAWEGTIGSIIPEPVIDWLEGSGTTEAPYAIETAEQLILVSKASILWASHFVLGADINLDPNLPGRSVFGQAVIPVFTGVLDGNDRVISHLTIKGGFYLGLFGRLASTGSISNLGLEAVEIKGTSSYVGALVGYNDEGSIVSSYSIGSVSGTADYVGGLMGRNYNGNIDNCYSIGSVSGRKWVGGLVGCSDWEDGSIAASYSTGTVNGRDLVGGLVGASFGSIAASYSTGTVTGSGDFSDIGGLVGYNDGSISNCYSIGAVTGSGYSVFGRDVGGLVGGNSGSIATSYSTGTVTGTGQYVGGLVGCYWGNDRTINCFWDTQTSGQAKSHGGTGKTTAEMQTVTTFIEAGWDFVDQTVNGTEDIWWINEGQDYPRLWWEVAEQ